MIKQKKNEKKPTPDIWWFWCTRNTSPIKVKTRQAIFLRTKTFFNFIFSK